MMISIVETLKVLNQDLFGVIVKPVPYTFQYFVLMFEILHGEHPKVKVVVF